MDPFSKANLTVRTKRSWLLVASLVVLLGAFVPAIVLFILESRAALFGLAAYHGLTFGLMHAWNRWWLERTGRVEADERGLWLDGALVVARNAVQHGDVVQRDGAVLVRLGRMLRPVDVRVADQDEGQALLRAMRLDRSRSVGEYPMNHGTYRSSWARAGAFLAVWIGSSFAIVLTTATTSFVVPFFAWAILGCAWAANQFVKVSVGADGIRLRRLLSRPRFIPFGALEKAETDGRNVTLRLRDGATIEVHHPAGKGWKPLLVRDREDDGRLLVERINGRIDDHRRAGAEVRALARGERSTNDWLREVALASDVHASFRAPAVPPDELWRVVEDPSAAATARAGAAVALRSTLDDEGRVRLRVLADACAAPRLRVALEVVAAADVAADTERFERAFEELEDEAPARARAR